MSLKDLLRPREYLRWCLIDPFKQGRKKRLYRSCLTDTPFNTKASKNLKGVVPLQSHWEPKVEEGLSWRDFWVWVCLMEWIYKVIYRFQRHCINLDRKGQKHNKMKGGSSPGYLGCFSVFLIMCSGSHFLKSRVRVRFRVGILISCYLLMHELTFI